MKVRRYAVPKIKTDPCAAKQPAPLYADLAGPMPVMNIGSTTSNMSVIIVVGYYSIHGIHGCQGFEK